MKTFKEFVLFSEADAPPPTLPAAGAPAAPPGGPPAGVGGAPADLGGLGGASPMGGPPPGDIGGAPPSDMGAPPGGGGLAGDTQQKGSPLIKDRNVWRMMKDFWEKKEKIEKKFK